MRVSEGGGREGASERERESLRNALALALITTGNTRPFCDPLAGGPLTVIRFFDHWAGLIRGQTNGYSYANI